MYDNDLRLKQAAKILLRHLLEQVFFDLDSDQANADFKRLITHVNNSKSVRRSKNQLLKH